MAKFINSIVRITRYMLGLGFLLACASMVDQYGLAQVYMVSIGLPEALLPWFVIVVFASAVALISGSGLRWAALAMALLAVISAALLPEGFADEALTATFFRNTSVAAVLLLLVAGCWHTGRHAVRARRLASIKHKLSIYRSRQP